MIPVIVNVFAVPDRAALACEVKRDHEAAQLEVRLWLDRERRGINWNCQRAYRAAEADPGNPWHLFLDDDVRYHPDTPRLIPQILNACEADLACLYAAHAAHRRPEDPSPWITCDAVWGAAYALRRRAVTTVITAGVKVGSQAGRYGTDGLVMACSRAGMISGGWGVGPETLYGERPVASTLGHSATFIKGHHAEAGDPHRAWDVPPTRRCNAAPGAVTKRLTAVLEGYTP